MKKLLFSTGGRPLANDDLSTLQQELTTAAQALYADAPICIVSGCRVSGSGGGAYIVSPGIVWCDGQLLRFPGQSAVTLPAQLQAGAEVLDQAQVRPYQNGTSLACMSEVSAVLVVTGTASAGEFLPLDTWGARRWADLQRAAARSLGELQSLAASGYVATNYDTTGRGRPGTEAWGWALANGQLATGTQDLRGLVMVGQNPDSSVFTTSTGISRSRSQNAPGDIGGEEKHQLTIAEMPQHTHAYQDRYTIERAAIDAGGNSRRDQDTTETKTTEPSGLDAAHNNMQPYCVVVMRQWIGFA